VFSDEAQAWVAGVGGVILHHEVCPAPNLQLSQGEPSWPPSLAVNTEGRFSYRITNTTVVAATPFRVALYVKRATDPVWPDEPEATAPYDQGLSAGASLEGVLTWTPDAPGSYALKIVADDLAKVPETEEADNVVEGRVTVTSEEPCGIWRPRASGTAELLSGIAFADATTGVAAGFGGSVLRTIDAGQSWKPVFQWTAQLRNAAFANATIGVVVGDRGTILRTTDAGQTWTSDPSATKQTLSRAHIHNATTRIGDGRCKEGI
jgi:hypothetical protein